MDGSFLIDTGAFIALLNGDYRLHDQATAFYGGVPAGVRRATTQAVVGECYTLLAPGPRRGGSVTSTRREAADTCESCTDEEDGKRAEHFLRRFGAQELSYIDALTLAVADRYHARAIFGFDHHLSLTGVAPLPGLRTPRR